ncbi:hypothetical protein LguiA_015372 [Lonicera macranthoides]
MGSDSNDTHRLVSVWAMKSTCASRFCFPRFPSTNYQIVTPSLSLSLGKSNLTMLILSTPASRVLFVNVNPRVSSSSSSSYSSSSKLALVTPPSVLSVRSSTRRCPFLVLCSSNSRGMAEIVEDKKSKVVVPDSSSASDQNELGISPTFLDARTGEGRTLMNYLLFASSVWIEGGHSIYW